MVLDEMLREWLHFILSVCTLFTKNYKSRYDLSSGGLGHLYKMSKCPGNRSNSLNKLRRLKCVFEICKTRPSHLRYVHVSKDSDTQVLNMCVCVSVQADAAVWHLRCDQRWSRYFLSVNDGSEQCATLPTAGGVHCQAGSRRGELVSVHVNVKRSHVTAINNVVFRSL